MRNEIDGSPVMTWEYGADGRQPPVLVCTECGAMVPPPYEGVHKFWHRHLRNEA